jgi:hypothetical protein
VNVRQVDVEQHEVRQLARAKPDRVFAGGRVDDVEPILAQGPAERVAKWRIVIDDKD